MHSLAENWRLVQGQLAIALVLAVSVALALGMIDILLAFAGGAIIGVALGYWVLPAIVDSLNAEELAGRLRRGRRRGR